MNSNEEKKPEARAKGVKRSLTLSAVLLLAAAAVWWFGAVSASDSRRALEKETSDLGAKTSEMHRCVNERDRMRREFDAVKERLSLFESALLKPQLGSYAMGAKDLLERISDEVGLSRARFENLPAPVLLPATKPASAKPYVRRRVKVTASGSYQKLAGFLCRVERIHPCVLTESVTIESAGGGEQLGTFVFDWLSEPDGEGVAK